MYQQSEIPTTTSRPDLFVLTTTSHANIASRNDDNDLETEYEDDSGDNNGNQGKINPFLLSAFNFITNKVLSPWISHQSNLDEGRVQVENKERNDAMSSDSSTDTGKIGLLQVQYQVESNWDMIFLFFFGKLINIKIMPKFQR